MPLGHRRDDPIRTRRARHRSRSRSRISRATIRTTRGTASGCRRRPISNPGLRVDACRRAARARVDYLYFVRKRRKQPSLLHREPVRVLSEVARVRIRRLLTLRHERLTEISGSTRLVGIIGWPVEHSLSPRMHNAAFAALGLDWAYVALPTPPERLEEAVRVASPRSGSPAQTSRRRTSWQSPATATPALPSVNTLVVREGRCRGTVDRHGDPRAACRSSARRFSVTAERQLPSWRRSRTRAGSRAATHGRPNSRTPTSWSTRRSERDAVVAEAPTPARRSSTSRTRRTATAALRAAPARVVSTVCEVLVAQGAAVVRALDGRGGAGRRHAQGRHRLGRVTLGARHGGRVARPGTRRHRHRAARRARARPGRDRRRPAPPAAGLRAQSAPAARRPTRSRCSPGLRHGRDARTPLALVVRNRDHKNWAWGMSPWPPDGDAEREGRRRRHAAPPGPRRPRRGAQVRPRRRPQRARAGERHGTPPCTSPRARSRRRCSRELGIDVSGASSRSVGPTTTRSCARRPTPRAPTATRSAASSRCVARRRPAGPRLVRAQKTDRLDARLAAALMGIQAVKGVEIGDGFALARAARLGGARRDRPRRASPPRDEPRRRDRGAASRTARPIVVRAAMKPLPTLMQPASRRSTSRRASRARRSSSEATSRRSRRSPSSPRPPWRGSSRAPRARSSAATRWSTSSARTPPTSSGSRGRTR